MIQIKAKQQNVSFEKNVEKLAFVLTAHLYNTLGSDKVIEEAALRSGVSQLSVGLWFLISPRLRQNLTRNP